MTLKTFQIPYGNTIQEVKLPEEKVIYDIHGNKAETKEDLCAETLRALREPIDSKPLAQLVKKGDKVTIIVSDLTRMVRTKEFLPVILDELNANDIADNDICIVVATGTHRGHTPAENAAVYGEDVCKRIKIYQHAIADDQGGSIKGNVIDIAFDSHGEALRFGRRTVKVYIL